MFEISRRDLVVSAATAAVAIGLPKRFAFLGASSAQAKVMAEQGFFKWKVGDVDMTALHDGEWVKAHDEAFIKGANVEDTKKALADGGQPNDAVHIPFNIMVASIGGKLVMFDSGTGGQVAPTAGLMTANMAKAGIDPAKITTIAMTHLHPDHIFGLMAKDTNAAVFPNAEILVSSGDYKFWTDPAMTGVPEGLKGVAQRIQATFPKWKNVRQIEGEAEVLPGIRSVSTPGHTPGHTSYQISSGGKVLYVLGDITNVPALFLKHPNWQAQFDTDGDLAQKTRHTMMDRVVAEGAQVAGYHYPFPAAGTVAKDGDGYAFTPAG